MKKPCETREKLLQVGFDLIWDSSYGSVSVDDICRRAGINKGSFYHFFPSKTDLVMAAYELHWQEKRPVMDRIFSCQNPPLERLHKFCQFLYDGQKEKAEKYGHVCGCPFSSVGSELACVDEKIRVMCDHSMSAMIRYLESAIADAIRDGLVTATDPVASARRANSLVLGLLLEARVKNSLEPLQDLADQVLNTIGARTVPA